MNKKILTFTMLLLLAAFVPMSLAISEPEKLGATKELPSYCADKYDIIAWSNYTAVACKPTTGLSASFLLQVRNSNTNNIIYNQTSAFSIASTAAPRLLYDNGFLLVSNILQSAQIFDVSNVGFIENLGWVNANLDVGEGAIIWTNQGENLFLTSTGTTAIRKWNETAVSAGAIGNLNTALESNTLFDGDNKIFTANDEILRYTDDVEGDYPDNNSDIVIYTIPSGKGSYFKDWNRNPNNPIYMTDTGYFITVGGSAYDDFASTSLNQFTGTPEFVGDTDNIISINTDGTWYLSDYTDFANPIHENTSTLVGADDLLRSTITRLVTINTTTDEWNVWSIPLPDFAVITQDGNTEPQIIFEFIGIDLSNRFVFVSTIEDNEGGRVYYDLDVNKFPEEITAGNFVSNLIDFNNENDLTLVDAGLCNPYLGIGSSSGNIQFDADGYLFSDQTNITCISDLIINQEQLTSLETPVVNIATSFGLSTGQTSVSLLNGNSERVFLFGLTLAGGVPDVYNLTYYDGATEVFILTNAALSGNDFWTFDIDLDFEGDTFNYTLFDEFGGVEATGTLPALLDVEDIDDFAYNEFSDQIDIIIDYVSYSYTGANFTPQYILYDSLTPGVPKVQSIRHPISQGFGVYIADLYATDETLGFDYIDNVESLEVFYTEETLVLTEEQIALAVTQQAQAAAGVGGVIDGDLLTDLLAGQVEAFGFKSTASKLLLALVLILVGLGIGYSYGIIGSFIGAVGGLIIAYFLGWVPAWILVTLVLGLIAIMALEARRMVAGGR